jgi:hypothetical protein
MIAGQNMRHKSVQRFCGKEMRKTNDFEREKRG